MVEKISPADVLKKAQARLRRTSEVNPRIIMVSMAAFAADGPARSPRLWVDPGAGVGRAQHRSMPGGVPGMNHLAYGDPIGGMNAAAAVRSHCAIAR